MLLCKHNTTIWILNNYAIGPPAIYTGMIVDLFIVIFISYLHFAYIHNRTGSFKLDVISQLSTFVKLLHLNRRGKGTFCIRQMLQIKNVKI